MATAKAQEDGRTTHRTVRLSAVAIALAVGLSLLYLAVRLVLGEAVAGAIVAALGFGYAALAFLSNTDKGDSGLRRAVVGMFRPRWFSYTAIALVWLGAGVVSAIPLTRGEFTITVIDEFRRPMPSAEIWLDFGDGERPLVNDRGVARASYFIPTAPRSVRIRVKNAGVVTTVTHKAAAGRRFLPLQISVWSGNPVLRVTHLTFEGMAIDSVLRGRLPPELAQRFKNISMVLPNAVFQTARELVDRYDISDDEDIRYLEDRVTPDRNPGPTAQKYYSEGDSPNFTALRNVRNVRPIYTAAAMDMSDDILGCPVVEPLRPGFRLLVNPAENYYLGAPVQPIGATLNWMTRHAPDAGGEGGTYSVLVDRALTTEDISSILQRNGGFDEFQNPDETKRLLRFLVRQRAPQGLIRGWARLVTSYDECAGRSNPVAIELQIPAPKLRITILENATDRPIRVDRFVQVTNERVGFGRRDGPARRVERSSDDKVYYEIQPGEAIIVPRELTMQSMVSEEVIRQADRSAPGEIATFELVAASPPLDDASEAPPEDDFTMRPRRISIDVSRIVVPPARREAEEAEEVEDTPEDIGYGPMGLPAGTENLVGSSVAELDYVVGGVRIRARTDTRTRVAMIGDTPSGSCPFVFVSYRGQSEPTNRGQIITDQIGAQAQRPDRLVIGRDFDAIEIRELEHERSYLDSARLLVPSKRGIRVYTARNALLERRDGSRLVLERGGSVRLGFGYRRTAGDGPATLEVDGYYVPIRMARR
ncbi:MAG: hypothetical protein ACJ8ER_03900 [Allosphingosinicella sp.]